MNTTISLVNKKGGAAKTASTVNLAFGLQKQGKRVLMIDLDPQVSLTEYFNLDPEAFDDSHRTLFFSMVEGQSLDNKIFHQRSEAPHLPHILVGGELLEDDDIKPLMAIQGEPYERLKTILREVRGHYDYILIDCPPAMNILTKNALVASQGVIIPVETKFESVRGFLRFLKTFLHIYQDYNPALEIIGILPTRFNRQQTIDQIAYETLTESLEESSIHIFRPIPNSVVFNKASAMGKAAGELYPRGRGVAEYQQVADYILNQYG